MKKQGKLPIRITQRTADGKKYVPEDLMRSELAQHTIEKINPIPFIPNETVSQKAMVAEFMVADLYLACLIQLINSGKIYDIRQFRQDFLALTEEENMKPRLEMLLKEVFPDS